jgi:hypothetical protein
MVHIGKQKCSVISNLKIMFVGGEIDERCAWKGTLLPDLSTQVRTNFRPVGGLAPPNHRKSPAYRPVSGLNCLYLRADVGNAAPGLSPLQQMDALNNGGSGSQCSADNASS